MTSVLKELKTQEKKNLIKKDRKFIIKNWVFAETQQNFITSNL